MAKVPLPYKAGNHLASYITQERAKRTVNSKKNVLLSDIEAELANYCSLTTDGIKAIKKHKSSTSLPVALKIAKYFNADVTDIFPLIDEEEEEITPEPPVRRVIVGVKRLNRTCSEDGCTNPVYLGGTCREHYKSELPKSN